MEDTQSKNTESDQDDQYNGADHEEQEEAPSEKKSIFKKLLDGKKRLVLMMGICLLTVVLILGIWLVFFTGSDSDEQSPPPIEEQQSGPDQEVWKAKPVFEDILEIAPFEGIVMKQGSAKGFVNMEISLLLSDPEDRVEVFSKMNEIRRVVQDNIRQKTWMDLRVPEGKIQCKYELLSAINGLFPKRVLQDLYIINFIML